MDRRDNELLRRRPIFQTWGEKPGRVQAISLTYLAGESSLRAMPPELER